MREELEGKGMEHDQNTVNVGAGKVVQWLGALAALAELSQHPQDSTRIF